MQVHRSGRMRQGTLIRVTTCWPIAVRHANAFRSHCHARGPLPRGRTGLFAASLEASAAALSSAAFCSAAFLAAMAAFREEEADILEAPGEPNLAGDDMALLERDGTDWHGRCCYRRITVALAGCQSRYVLYELHGPLRHFLPHILRTSTSAS